MSQNAQNAADQAEVSAILNGAVDQGANEQANATPEQGAEKGNSDPNAGVTIDPEEVSRIEAERAERASKAALTSYLKQQGLSQAEAEEYFKQHRAKKEAEREQARNDLGMLQQENQQLQTQMAETLQKANNTLIRAEAKVTASKLGVRADRLDHVIRLATLKDVTVDDDGVVDQATVRTAIEQVLEEIPELRQTEDNRPGFKIGGTGRQAATNTAEGELSKIFGNSQKEK